MRLRRAVRLIEAAAKKARAITPAFFGPTCGGRSLRPSHELPPTSQAPAVVEL